MDATFGSASGGVVRSPNSKSSSRTEERSVEAVGTANVANSARKDTSLVESQVSPADCGGGDCISGGDTTGSSWSTKNGNSPTDALFVVRPLVVFPETTARTDCGCDAGEDTAGGESDCSDTGKTRPGPRESREPERCVEEGGEEEEEARDGEEALVRDFSWTGEEGVIIWVKVEKARPMLEIEVVFL